MRLIHTPDCASLELPREADSINPSPCSCGAQEAHKKHRKQLRQQEARFKRRNPFAMDPSVYAKVPGGFLTLQAPTLDTGPTDSDL